MTIDWQAISTISAPIFALFIGVWINRWFENRPSLITYMGHASAFSLINEGITTNVHTHSVVLRNIGRRSATNVRIAHNVVPDFNINIWPIINYSVNDLPGGGKEILIPTLVPNELITISYLYFPPVIATQVNAGIKCDQGFAKNIPVLTQRQYPNWLSRALLILVGVGFVSLVYLLFVLAKMLF